MIDRLIPLLLALTVAAPAVVRPACCCTTPGVEEACCQAKAKSNLPPCCQQDADPAEKVPCGCTDCPATRPLDPLLALTNSIQSVPANEGPAGLAWIDARPPLDARLARRVALGPLQPDRPPPDRQALLCVWTI